MRMNRGLGAISNPATALVDYTRAIERSQEPKEEWPYNWVFPGSHSRHVLSQGSLPVPDYVAASGPATGVVLQYVVPDGMRFSLRGVVVAANVASWNQGSTDMTFTLAVVSGGNRNVDFLFEVNTELGSLQEGPYPIGGRLEFESLDVLEWSVTASANVGIGSPNFVICHLWGHTYPTSEAYG